MSEEEEIGQDGMDDVAGASGDDLPSFGGH